MSDIRFDMKVYDIFHLESGYTVFAGSVDTTQSPVKEIHAELIVDGHRIRRFDIQGEFLMDRKHPKGYRAISTLESIDIDSDFVKTHDVSIRAIPGQATATG